MPSGPRQPRFVALRTDVRDGAAVHERRHPVGELDRRGIAAAGHARVEARAAERRVIRALEDEPADVRVRRELHPAVEQAGGERRPAQSTGRSGRAVVGAEAVELP